MTEKRQGPTPGARLTEMSVKRGVDCILYTCRNKAPPSSALGTASPAYVEARRYFPANAPRRQVFIC